MKFTHHLTSCIIGKKTRSRSHFSAVQGAMCLRRFKSNSMKINLQPREIFQLIAAILVLTHFVLIYLTGYHSWLQFLYLFMSVASTVVIYQFIRNQVISIGMGVHIKTDQKIWRLIALITSLFMFILFYGSSIKLFIENN